MADTDNKLLFAICLFLQDFAVISQFSQCLIYFRLNIYVDDTEVAENRLRRNFDSLVVREDGGLYLGGVPQGLKVDNMAGSDVSLDGCLSDIVIKGK